MWHEGPPMWQPIDSAPKDKRIMLYIPDDENGYLMTFGRYYHDRFSERPEPYWRCDIGAFFNEFEMRKLQPTYWADPSPPEAE